MNQIELLFQTLVAAIDENFDLLLGLVIGLWSIQILNWLCGYRLNQFGILPRTFRGLIGIVLSPFLHGNASHLFFNTIPLLVLACFILVGGKTLFFSVSISIILLSGFLVWLLGRRAIHIGASGLIMGYWGYLLVSAFLYPSLLTIVLAIVSVYYFGGLFFGLFPSSEKNVSWEGHLFGCLSGIVANFIFPFISSTAS